MESSTITAVISLLIAFTILPLAASNLSYDYYSRSCPRFFQIVQETVTNKQITNPTTAAGTLRLFLHDCLVTGCDGSVLVSSTPFNLAERDADINLSLPGDAFDLLTRIKTALELACPVTVSCADILAVAARDLLTMAGGPHYEVPLGRLDYRISSASYVEGNIPRPTMPLPTLTRIFTSKGFSVREMVALSGAHTIGFSHCKEFAPYLTNDTGYNPRFARALGSACGGYESNKALSVFNDVITPNKFDNVYYQNLGKGLGLLRSDHAFYEDPETRVFVEMYANDQDLFFKDFASAMVKLSLYGVKTGGRGEIRRRCDAVN